jgi:hypothetical protein
LVLLPKVPVSLPYGSALPPGNGPLALPHPDAPASNGPERNPSAAPSAILYNMGCAKFGSD